MSHSIVREKLERGEFFFAPGIHDMMAAVLADKVGFEIVYGTGYWLTASAYGLPDAGIATYTQMLDRVSTLARTTKAAVIADADTGYGGLLNVHHTVRGYEDAGITGIQIEDQEFPKKCGHTPGKKCVALEEMTDKIKVACEARRDPRNTLIIARTDCRQGDGFDAAVKRGAAFAEAGADIVFVEALYDEDEMRRVCNEIDAPMIANMADGGDTPIRSAEELADIGYACAIYPATTALAANHAIEQALRNLKENGTTANGKVPLYDFKEFCSLIGFEEVWAFDKKWARDD
jgi:2-methylisocitrate lyase-like PEP mutase family enzyme